MKADRLVRYLVVAILLWVAIAKGVVLTDQSLGGFQTLLRP